MATRKTKSVPTQVAPPPGAPMTLTLPVPAPRNRLAVNPLLKKSSAHEDARKRQPRNDLLLSWRDGLDGLEGRAVDRCDDD